MPLPATIPFLPKALTEGRAAVSLLPQWEYKTAALAPFNFLTAVREGYYGNPIVFACIREIVTSYAEAPFNIVTETDGVTQKVMGHPAKVLMDNPNPDMTGYEFWEALLTFEALAGNAYVLKWRNEVGRVVELSLLNPGCVRIQPQRDGNDIYWYRVGGQELPFRRRDIIHFKWAPDPDNDLYGYSPVRTVLPDILFDNKATAFFNAFFDNAAVPYSIIKIKRRLRDEKEANRIREKWKKQYTGLKGWHSPAVVDEDADIQQLGSNFRNMVIEAMRDVPESHTAMAFGVPPILIGANVGLKRSTYTNYPVARTSFWQETLVPMFQKHAAKLQSELVTEFPRPRRFKAVFDLTAVAALQPDMNDVYARVSRAVDTGWLPVNAALQAVGLNPVANGDVFLRKNTVTAVEVEPMAGAQARSVRHYWEFLPDMEESVRAAKSLGEIEQRSSDNLLLPMGLGPVLWQPGAVKEEVTT